MLLHTLASGCWIVNEQTDAVAYDRPHHTDPHCLFSSLQATSGTLRRWWVTRRCWTASGSSGPTWKGFKLDTQKLPRSVSPTARHFPSIHLLLSGAGLPYWASWFSWNINQDDAKPSTLSLVWKPETIFKNSFTGLIVWHVSVSHNRHLRCRASKVRWASSPPCLTISVAPATAYASLQMATSR